MRVFFDSSAFARRYLGEAGSDAVVEWCDKATEIVLSGVALPEIISAFCRLRREGHLRVCEKIRNTAFSPNGPWSQANSNFRPLRMAQDRFV